MTSLWVNSETASVEAIRRTARHKFNLSIAGGLADLEDKIIRIGHLGDVNTPMILGCLATMEAVFQHLGVKFETGMAAATAALSEPH